MGSQSCFESSCLMLIVLLLLLISAFILCFLDVTSYRLGQCFQSLLSNTSRIKKLIPVLLLVFYFSNQKADAQGNNHPSLFKESIPVHTAAIYLKNGRNGKTLCQISNLLQSFSCKMSRIPGIPHFRHYFFQSLASVTTIINPMPDFKQSGLKACTSITELLPHFDGIFALIRDYFFKQTLNQWEFQPIQSTSDQFFIHYSANYHTGMRLSFFVWNRWHSFCNSLSSQTMFHETILNNNIH